jgi:integrase
MLTDIRIRNAKPGKKTIKLTDGRGLYIEITPSGGKHWRYRYRLNGKESTFVIGEYPEIGAADARARRDEARKLIDQGINPTQERKLAKVKRQHENATTFQSVAEEWFANIHKKWTPEYAFKVKALLNRDVHPRLGDLPIKLITASVIMPVLKRIEARGAATQALLARQLISSIFRHAIITNRAENDPAFPLKGIIALRKPEHRKHLDRRDLPAFLLSLEDYTGHVQTVTAVKLLLLTAVRPCELCEAEWSEFDVENSVWNIPAARMKMRARHIVPLSTQAVELIEQLRSLTGDGKFLFPSQGTKAGAIPTATLRNVIRRMGYQDKVSPHGFRGTFSTLMNECGYRPDIIERQLAHAEPNRVRAAYHHAEYLHERKIMMQDWADKLDGFRRGAKIIPLHGRAAK